MHSISKLHRGWEWKSSLTHYPTTTTNKYPLVRFRCINVKMTREFGWDGITRWQESYSTSPIPPSYLVVWFVLFVITNATVILGRLVYFVCHQPSSPSYWLLGLSCLLSTNFTIIFGCSQYFQQGWTHQCRYIWNNVGLLCCPVLLEVVVASDSGKYQQPTVVDTILVILVNTMLPTNYFNSSAVASYTVIRSDHNKSNMCPRQSLVFRSTLIVEWETSQSTISRLRCHIKAIVSYQDYSATNGQSKTHQKLFQWKKIAIP